MNQQATPVSPAKFLSLPLAQIKPDPAQPRKAFDAEALKELADSLATSGCLQPLLVRPNGTGYIIIDGERRFRAAQAAKLTELPAVVRPDLTLKPVGDLQLIANLQRADLTLAEQCAAVTALVEIHGLDETATRLGKSKPWVSKRAAYKTMSGPVRNLVDGGKVVDIEIAAGLSELQQVAPPKAFEQTLEQVKKPSPWDAPLTRDELRGQIRDAKAEKAAREKAAAEAAKHKKLVAEGKTKPDPWKAKQAKERTLRELNLAAWKAIMPALQAFAGTIGNGLGIRVDAPRFSEYNPAPAPKSVDSAAFTFRVEGNAAAVGKFVSRTGLTVRLDSDDLPHLTPEQAAKVEKAIGRPLRWYNEYDNKGLTGKQWAHAAKKAGIKIDAPPAAAKVAAPAPAKAAVKKKARK